MFGRRYFAGSMFGPRMFGAGGDTPPAFDAGAVWAHVLPNGKTAAQNLVEINEAMRILLAVAAGRTEISALGGGAALVQFFELGGTDVVVEADMQGSERVNVTIDPAGTT